jgi:hypothetical protein
VKNAGGSAKWVGVWLLQLPLYLLTSYVIRELIGNSYRLLIRAGATLPPNLLLQHFLWIGVVGGFFAGLIGLQLLRATLLILPPHANAVTIAPWKRPQAWTWAIPSLWLAYGVFAWLGNHARYSVLSSLGTTRPDAFAAFFGDGCHLAGSNVGISIIIYCMPQLTFTHPWLGSIGYSAAAFVPSDWFGQLRRRPPMTENLSSPEHTEKTEAETHA